MKPFSSTGIVFMWLNLQTSFASVTIQRCPLVAAENTQNYHIICSGFGGDVGIEWKVDFGDGSLEERVGTCANINQCVTRRPLEGTFTRPTMDTSHMIIKNVTRLYSKATFKCLTTSSELDSCLMDVIYGAEVSECKVQVTKDGLWNINGSCTIMKVFSSRNNYTCELLQTEISGISTSLGKKAFYPSLNNNNPPYASGSCSFTGLGFPTNSGTYNYTFNILPGNVIVQAGIIAVDKPTIIPDVPCSLIVKEYGNFNCTCNSRNLGTPGGRLAFYRGNTLLLLGNYGDVMLSFPKRTFYRNESEYSYRCVLDWATANNEDLYNQFYINIAYGPDTVSITDPGVFDIDPHKNATMTLHCLPSDAKPNVSIRWSERCSFALGNTCTITPTVHDDDVMINCTVTNTYADLTKVASLKLVLNYPPMTAPEIQNYADGQILYAGDSFTMTCSVKGGKPVNETKVFFTCPGKETDANDVQGVIDVSSSLTFDPLDATDHGITCTCSAQWKSTNFYTMQTERRLTVYYKSFVSNLTLSGNPDVLTINESSSVDVQLLCVAQGRPTPEIRLTQEGQRDLIRQIGGNIEKDQASLTYQVSSNCESTGRYNCETNNRIGEPDVASVLLYVQCSPRSVSSTNTPEIPSVNFKGSARNLSFEVISIPPPDKFRFLYLGTTYNTTATQQPARSNIFEISCSSDSIILARAKCTLTVDKVNDGDKGYYEVIVINSFGNTSFLFRLAINETEPSELQNDNSETDDKTAVIVGVSMAVSVIVIVIVVVTVFIIRRKKHLNRTRKPDHTEVAKIESISNDPLSQLKDTENNIAKPYDSLRIQDVGVSSPYEEINRYEMCSQADSKQEVSPVSGPVYENNSSMEQTV